MKHLLKGFAACLMIGLIALSVVSVGAANPGGTDNAPQSIGKTSTDDKGVAKCDYVVTGKTNANGGITFNLKNISESLAQDLHIRLKKPLLVSKISVTEALAPLSKAMDQPDGTEGREVGIQVGAGQTGVANGETQVVSIKLEIADSMGGLHPWALKEVEFCVWWSQGVERTDVVSGRSTGTAGQSVMLAEASLPGWQETAPTMSETTVSAQTKSFAIAENNGWRFKQGSVLFSVDGNGKFLADAENPPLVQVFNTLGQLISDPSRIAISNPRFDDEGNFVFDVVRNRADDEDLIIYVRNISATNLQTYDGGAIITASVSGAAIGAGCMESAIELLNVQ